MNRTIRAAVFPGQNAKYNRCCTQLSVSVRREKKPIRIYCSDSIVRQIRVINHKNMKLYAKVAEEFFKLCIRSNSAAYQDSNLYFFLSFIHAKEERGLEVLFFLLVQMFYPYSGSMELILFPSAAHAGVTLSLSILSPFGFSEAVSLWSSSACQKK